MIFQFGQVFLALAAEAAFLNAEVVELALIGDENMRVDQSGANGSILVFELAGELEAAKGVDAHLERGNAKETPLRISERLDEIFFVVTDGLMVFEISLDVPLISSGIIGGQQDSAAGETGFNSIQRRFGFARRRRRPGRQLSIGSIRKDLRGRGHGGGTPENENARCTAAAGVLEVGSATRLLGSV